MSHESKLRDAMLKFRQDWAPKVIIKPRMHYNYSSLQHAFELLDREWKNLYRASGNDYTRIYEARGGFSPHTVASFGKLMSNKNIKLAELMQSHPAYQQAGCVMH